MCFHPFLLLSFALVLPGAMFDDWVVNRSRFLSSAMAMSVWLHWCRCDSDVRCAALSCGFVAKGHGHIRVGGWVSSIGGVVHARICSSIWDTTSTFSAASLFLTPIWSARQVVIEKSFVIHCFVLEHCALVGWLT